MSEQRVCYCDCHRYPGTYNAEPCSVCGHYHSAGEQRPGWNGRGGWVPKEERARG